VLIVFIFFKIHLYIVFSSTKIGCGRKWAAISGREDPRDQTHTIMYLKNYLVLFKLQIRETQ